MIGRVSSANGSCSDTVDLTEPAPSRYRKNAVPLPTLAANAFFGATPGKIGAVTVQRGYMLRHGHSRLTASDVVGSLQLTCVEAPLHKPR
jgi:hypothetical protein